MRPNPLTLTLTLILTLTQTQTLTLTQRALEKHERTPFSLEGPLLEMERQEHLLACHSSLLGKVLKEGLNGHALGELVQHYCFGSQRTTTDVLQCVLPLTLTLTLTLTQP